MEVSFDPAKNERNIRERGLSFELAGELDFETALFEPDTRHDYGEQRVRVLGRLKGRVHALVFVETSKRIRVISFCKANAHEVNIHGQETQDPAG
jgi:uncharacterized DUF497 family protein